MRKSWKFPRLSQKGIAHHMVLVALVVITVVSAIGYRVLTMSNAATLASSTVRVATKDGCWLAGRVWDEKTSDCTNVCRNNAGTLTKKAGSDGVTRSYCSNAVAANMEPAVCTDVLHRFYINELGCSRRVDQDNTNGARQCLPGFPNYIADGARDKCIAATIVAQPTTTNGDTKPKGDVMSATQCAQLGRTYDTASQSCNRVCTVSTDILLKNSDGKYYCMSAVATSISQTRCTQLNRAWIDGLGCARRSDNKDVANDPVHCVPGFPYYNSNSEASKSGKLDVCEKDKATSDANEASGVIGGVKVTQSTETGNGDTTGGSSGSGTDTTGGSDGSTAADTGYKITVYAKKNFEGESKTFTAAQTDLKAVQFNDRVSSYKVQQGRWQLCSGKDYEPDCMTTWASDPDLAAGNKTKLNDKLSSLRPRPVTDVEYENPAVDTKPVCVSEDGTSAPLNGDGSCEDGQAMTCPTDGLVVVDGECKEKVITTNEYLPVDTSFKKTADKKDIDGEDKCLLLGRQWIENGNGGDHGCSMVTCNLKVDGAPKSNDGKPFCVSYKHDAAYAVAMTEKECKDLNRVWIAQVERCAQVPNRDDANQTVVNAPQCTGKTTTYYIYKGKDKQDECFNPSFFQKAQKVAKVTGGVLGNVLHVGPKAFCMARSGYHWDKHANTCRKDPPPSPALTTTTADAKVCQDGSQVAIGEACKDGKPPKKYKCEANDKLVNDPSDCPKVYHCNGQVVSSADECRSSSGTTCEPGQGSGCSSSPTVSNVSCSTYNSKTSSSYSCPTPTGPRGEWRCTNTVYYEIRNVSKQVGNTIYKADVCAYKVT